MGHVTWPRPFQGQFVVRRLGFAMINTHTKFKNSSLSCTRDILGGLKIKIGHVTWPRPFKKHFVICRLGLALFNPHSKFKVSSITCNEEMKGNTKCKNSRFEPPFGGLRDNAHGSSMARWKACCRLPIRIIELFSLALTAAALLSKICQNRRFLKGWVILIANFW